MPALQEVVSTDFLSPQYAVVWHSGKSADGVSAELASRWPLGEVAEAKQHISELGDDAAWKLDYSAVERNISEIHLLDAATFDG